MNVLMDTYTLGLKTVTEDGSVFFTTGSVSGLTPAESHTYTYGNSVWKDQLTAHDGVTIQYDDIGNPTNDGTWQYTWQHGKQLRQMQKTESGVTTTIVYEYNEDGLRTKKTVTVGEDETVTEYILHGKNIVHMTQGTHELHFYYDAQGRPSIVIYDGTAYGYLYNLQGDVVAIVDSSGAKVVEYGYDAWGKPTLRAGSLASTLGTVQPFRYRGYVFDEETGLYYLRSRYYRPGWGRFVSADAIYTSNIYAYCMNAPMGMRDKEGTWGRHDSKMPVLSLLQMLYSMLEDNRRGKQWKYRAGQRRYALDCIGMICYCAEQYFTITAFGPEGFNVKKGTRLAQKVNIAIDENRIRCFYPINGDYEAIPRGAVVYYGDYSHVGVYVGAFDAPDGKHYEHAVIHSEKSFGVHVTEMEDRHFVYYCLFSYIDYSINTDSTIPYYPWTVVDSTGDEELG